MGNDNKVGIIQIPHVRWGGRWSSGLNAFNSLNGDQWVELAEYSKTSAYQVARSLNLGASLPAPPDGKVFEFGARIEPDDRSILLVRVVDAK